jgi:uncharacterized protein (TIGR02001 family)
MKLKPLSLLVMTALSAPIAAQAAEESPHKLSANVGIASDYIFRGISQTGGDPAIQGGLDYTHSSGFYLGTWGSNVGWLEDFQGYSSGNLEIDLYGGFRGNIGSTDFTFDVGVIQYWYPGDNDGPFPDADTTEIYAGLGWKWFAVKYFYGLSDDVFGIPGDSADYFDVSASYPVGETGLTLGAHWGTFSWNDTSDADYDDWNVSMTYDMGKLSKVTEGVTLGVKYTDTNAEESFWTDANGEYLGDSTFVVWVTKAF